MDDEEVIVKMLEHIEHQMMKKDSINLDRLYGYRIDRGTTIKKLKIGLDNSLERFYQDNKGAWVCIAFVRPVLDEERDPLDNYFDEELK